MTSQLMDDDGSVLSAIQWSDLMLFISLLQVFL